MKKLFSIILMLVCATGFAQVPLTTLKAASGLNKDTVVAATAKYLYLRDATGKLMKIAGRNELTVMAGALEISGTTTGNVRLESSVDSTNWYPYYLGTQQVDTAGSNYRLTLADVTTAQNMRWYVPVYADSYFRLAAIGGGTTNWSVFGKLQVRPLPK